MPLPVSPFRSQAFFHSFDLNLWRTALASFAPGYIQMIVQHGQCRVHVCKAFSAELNVLNDAEAGIENHQTWMIRIGPHVPTACRRSGDITDQCVFAKLYAVGGKVSFDAIVPPQFGQSKQPKIFIDSR